MLAIAATVLVLLAGGAVLWYLRRAPDPVTPADSDLSAVIDFRATQPTILERRHQDGPIAYTVSPPVGGFHNPRWQNCMGDVYSTTIPSERAVHSLEHGAVWITYDPAAVDAATISALAQKVRGKQYLLMSPYPGQQPKISIQAWGYQLALSLATDPRLDGFIYKYRINASVEPGAPCSGGETSATL